MADIPITTHQRSARAILAVWRRNRPKAVADAISGSAAFELVESIEGALVMLDQDHNATIGATTEASARHSGGRSEAGSNSGRCAGRLLGLR